MRKLFSRSFCFGMAFALGMAVASAATRTVSISGFSFSPAIVTVTNGDTVMWINGGGGHTVSPKAGVTEAFCGGSAITSCSYTFNAVGSFAYQCNFHLGFNMTGVVHVVAAPGVPPTISITNPPSNKLFAAPGVVQVGVMAADSDGNVANVRLLTNGAFAATSTVAPFGFTLSNLPAGFYTLRARAEDNQSLFTTSSPVTVRVATRPALSFERGSNGPLRLQFNSVTGVNYVIQGATNVTNFSSIATNAGTGSPLQFSQTNPAPSERFFRVRLE